MSAPLVLRYAVCSEAAQITALALRSKAFWGYDAQFMRHAAAELAVSEQDIADRDIFVAQAGETLIGVAGIDDVTEPPELDLLFVEPARIGDGVGRALLRHALQAARARGLRELAIASDPHAEAFYLSHGAVRVGAQRSPSTGRKLPLLRIATDAP